MNFKNLISETISEGNKSVNVRFTRVDGSETTKTVTSIIEETNDRFVVGTSDGNASFYVDNILEVNVND